MKQIVCLIVVALLFAGCKPGNAVLQHLSKQEAVYENKVINNRLVEVWQSKTTGKKA